MQALLPRERVAAALEFRAPDVIPVRIYPAPGGLHEHGRTLVDLIQACGHDFGDLGWVRVPDPPRPEDVDPDGSYHAFRTDDWGTRWEFRIFGVWGHPVAWPLDDLGQIETYRFPPAAPAAGPALERAQAQGAELRRTYFHLEGATSLLEKMISLRRFEDVLIDVAEDAPAINRLADRLTEYSLTWVQRALAVGADAVSFGDDFGTTQAPLFSPQVWRRFFKPRYAALVAPIRRAGKRAFLHSCGQVGPLLEDFAEIGFSAIWPQLPLFAPRDLAQRCRQLGLAVELHPDRGELMQHGSPAQVRDYVRRVVDECGSAGGGSWLYLEVDPHFPYPNVAALFETTMKLRGC